MLSTPIPFIPWQSGLPFPRYNLTMKIQVQRSRSKVPQSAQRPVDSFPYCFTSGHPIDSRPFRSWLSGLPFPRYNLILKIQGQRYPSQRSIQLTHFRSFSHQGILSTPVPFIPWQLGLPFPRYNLTLEIKGQRSRSKVKVKGTLVSIASSWLISFLFHINWTNHS